ncbi:unnamed protein product [Polarella glacialis]|uniref:UBR-type domain-containing protein n=1 Tax=Polarella glacialis TaxID=89957 RepID=A0A813D3Q6_POLGL|nr:unnamed protein product [Polarella glacialis]
MSEADESDFEQDESNLVDKQQGSGQTDENNLVDAGLLELKQDPGLQTLEAEYDSLASGLPLHAAHSLSAQDTGCTKGPVPVEDRRAAGKTDELYGEMGWWAMAGIFHAIAANGGLPSEFGDFVDVGSGSGTAIAAAGLLVQHFMNDDEGQQRFRRLRGVECCVSLHAASSAVAEAWASQGHLPQMELELGDAADMCLTGAVLVLAHSTAFSDELILTIAERAEKAIPPGGWVVTLTRPLPRAAARGWDIVEARRRTVSWGAATCFLHRRRHDSAPPPCTYHLAQECYSSQVWFHCKSCGLDGDVGICAPCAAVCHGDCEGVEFAAHSPFFCDCKVAGGRCCSRVVGGAC